MRKDAVLNLVLAKKERLVGNVNLKGSLGCSDHEIMEFQGSKEGGQQDHYLEPL